jgi:hypothetical protein
MEKKQEDLEILRWRLVAIETVLNGKSGVLDRLEHLDKCVDSLKRTVWMATGATTIIGVLATALLTLFKL